MADGGPAHVGDHQRALDGFRAEPAGRVGGQGKLGGGQYGGDAVPPEKEGSGVLEIAARVLLAAIEHTCRHLALDRLALLGREQERHGVVGVEGTRGLVVALLGGRVGARNSEPAQDGVIALPCH
jgi:hypothetical protein